MNIESDYISVLAGRSGGARNNPATGEAPEAGEGGGNSTLLFFS